MTPLVLDHLRARRVAAVVLPVALLGLAVGYLALFPQLEAQLQAFAGDIPEFYDALVGDADFATAEGYVRSQVYALVAPLLVAGVTISVATRLGRDERDVTLVTTYLAPVGRGTLAASYLVAAWSVGLVAGLGVFVGVAVGAPLAGADVGLVDVVAATVPLVGFAWAASGIAWAVAAATGSPGAASASGWAFVGLSFLANSIGEVVGDLEVLTQVSPWGWYGAGAAVTDGFDPTSLLLFAVAAVATVVGLWRFQARDLQL